VNTCNEILFGTISDYGILTLKLNAMKKIYTLALIALTSHYGFGGELFIRVTRAGSHAATVASQMQSNSTNVFRFFELPGGNTSITVKDQFSGNTVFNGFMNIGANQRVVGEVNNYGNFSVIETTTINNGGNWYTPGTVVYVPNPSYPNGGYGNGYPNGGYGNGYPNGGWPNNGYPNGGYGNGYPNGGWPNNGGGWGNNTNSAAFGQFLEALDDESFDSDKLTMAKGYVNQTNLSAQQIADISTKFDFDSNRLEWAKHAYGKCYDKQNYFLLKSTFDFSSSYSALAEYIEGQ
jgi:hypothetical protein